MESEIYCFLLCKVLLSVVEIGCSMPDKAFCDLSKQIVFEKKTIGSYSLLLFYSSVSLVKDTAISVEKKHLYGIW